MAKSAWSSSSARLSRDSFLPFGSCSLCLETAVHPVSCSLGHIFCRECALSNILAQKKEIKRLEKAREQGEQDALDLKAQQDAEAQERAVNEFELTQAGLDVRVGRPPDSSRDTRSPSPTLKRHDPGDAKRGQKRKFSLDEDEVLRSAADDRAKARRAIEDEKNAKPTLPSFWIPSAQPKLKRDGLHEIKKAPKTSPICPASQEKDSHHYSLRTLVTINFTEERDAKAQTSQRICPSCRKGLTNTSKAMLAKPCGHVLCKACTNQFMKPAGHIDPHALDADPNAVRCYVCDEDVTERKKPEKNEKKDKDKLRPGIVELRSDGTGYSAGGVKEVKKSSSAFQC